MNCIAGWALHGSGKAQRGGTWVSRAASECSAAGAEASHKGMGMVVLTVRIQMAERGQ